MIEEKVDFIMPDYIKEEIEEYIEETNQGRYRCMKWENIRALLRLAMIRYGPPQNSALGIVLLEFPL